MANEIIKNAFTCPLKTCWCGGPLHNARPIAAKCQDLVGVKDVTFTPKQCNRRKCRTMYGYNYYWLGGKKVSCVGIADLKGGVLFTSSKRCFTLRYLKFFNDLAFRGFLSSRATMWAYARSFAPPSDADKTYGCDILAHADEVHTDALMYYLALQEFGDLENKGDIVIGGEISAKNLKEYEIYLHEKVYPPDDPTQVKLIVGDGHAKVMTKCEGHSKRAGRPRKLKKQRRKALTNGWFMVCEPGGRVLVVQQQIDPENNDDVEKAFVKAVGTYPSINCCVYDRNCSFAPTRSANPVFRNVKSWPVDKWHGHRHKKKCKYSPKNVKRYRDRLKRVNTSVCEQVFSWFRGHARVLNEMKASRNHFLVLYYVRKHNELMSQDDTSHLNQHKRSDRLKRGHYMCD